MNRILWICFLFIGCKQSTDDFKTHQAHTDSLLYFLQFQVNPTIERGETDGAGRLLDSIYPFVKKLNDERLTYRWLLYKRTLYNAAGQQDSAEIYLNEAIRLSSRRGAPAKEQLEVKGDLVDQLKDEKKYDSALKVGTDFYYLAKKVDTHRVPQACMELVNIYGGLNDLASARKYLFEGFEKAKDGGLKALFANNIASYYDTYGKIDSAVYYFKLWQKDTTSRAPELAANLEENLGILLIKNGRKKEGLEHQMHAVEVYRKLGMMDATAYLNLSETFTSLQQFEKADLYLDSCLLLASSDKDYESLKEAWYDRASNYQHQKLFEKGYAALDSAYKYHQIEVDSSMMKYSRDLETKYAVRSKDDQIKSLAFANQANLKIRNQQRFIILIMVLAILLIAVIVVLLWRRKQMQLQLRETGLQQQQLRSQMEPHFIFNTLSVLQGFIRNGEKENAIQYLNKAAKLLRISFENARESFVPLHKEINALESYLKLQMMNFENLFEYTISMYDSYEGDNILIPPMLLQPFVENSILHGFKNLDHKGLIIIRISKDDDMLHCMIDDNGHGFQNAENGKREKLGSSIITQERLSILTKQLRKKANLVITNKETVNEGEGVRVELDIPFKKSDSSTNLNNE